ncbi:hypothetical protein RVR_4168 [Actinacidiphila reveromycinica]|uniref:Chlorophyllase n=1 Tax=Actinacidiphila reveromycinica TaxID=659352 RepID=A0A7U3VNY1_9ACTN|nr:chlorophyllase [Streptomyces sp. SN-593]BBA98109.1 hypothetical protein RVR_4168 [Streptomyces sp. SN-593]
MINNLLGPARHLPVTDAVPTVTVNPVTLPAPDRGLSLELRVTAPVSGRNLPVVLLSHGGGDMLYLPSKDGLSPLTDFYAAHGFAVIQPTHLSSRLGGFGLDPTSAGHPVFWRSRVEDFTLILDNLLLIEAQAPAVAGRLDPARVAVVGHSGGAHTAAVLLGARVPDPDGGEPADLRDPRITAGVLLAPTGGGERLTAGIRARFPEFAVDFSHLTTRTLVVYGDADVNPDMFTGGADWHAEPYHRSPGADALLTLVDGRHSLGGVVGYDASSTDDADPDRLAVTQRLTWAYLRSAFDADDPAWEHNRAALREKVNALGHVQTK